MTRRPDRRDAVRAMALTLALALGSCGGEDTFSPTVAITLAVDGTTSGRLFVPGGADDGSDLDVDLSGTWTLSGSTVTFNQAEDTFIRDVDFTAGPNRLNGEGEFSGAIIRLVLGKAD